MFYGGIHQTDGFRDVSYVGLDGEGFSAVGEDGVDDGLGCGGGVGVVDYYFCAAAGQLDGDC